MKVPISWLEDYVDIDMPVNDLAERLTLAGLEVAGIQYLGLEGAELPWDPERIRVGQILAVKPHPDAERLVLADVDFGADQIETVVTGAPNLFPYLGQDTRQLNLKSPFAMEGVTLYDGHKTDGAKMKLKGRAIRGIMNRHMLCSEKELGISDYHEGILIMGLDAPVGTPLVDVLGTAVLDIDLTPNLARCSSMIGVARELAALTGQKIRYPDYGKLTPEGPSLKGQLILETTEPELNPRFCAALIQGIEIKPSPFWMQLRLRLAGMRPINNIVDATNYVMLEMGQPNHAFDFDVLRKRADQYGGKDQPVRIITRLARPGEHVVTLDDVDRAMEPFTILVTDPAGPLSIGAIMGGAESEVHEGSTNILLEAASWNFINIRRSTKALNLPSEAAYRLSRGVHPSQSWLGVLRAAYMMQLVSGGTVARDIADYYPFPPEPVVVDLPATQVTRILGVDLPIEESQRILESLEFECKPTDADSLQVTVPDHRLDINTGVVGQADLIEEIARIYGYDRIPETQIDDAMPPQRDNVALNLENQMKSLLVEAGLQEIITYRFSSPEHEALLLRADETGLAEERPYVKLANPIAAERSVMRQSLLASDLDVLALNARHRDRVRLFEIGPVFLPSQDRDTPLPDEVQQLVVTMTGPRQSQAWQAADLSPADFFDLKGIVEDLIDGLHIPDVTFEPIRHPSYRPGRVASIVVNGEQLGVLGQIHPLVQEAFAIPADNPVLAAEINLDRLSDLIPGRFKIRPVPRFPAIHQDIAVVVDESLSAEQVRSTILEAGGQLLTDVQLFDVYRGDQLEADKKSLAYSLTFQSPDRTLTDKQAAKTQTRIVKILERTLGAKLRE